MRRVRGQFSDAGRHVFNATFWFNDLFRAVSWRIAPVHAEM
jgi:hypothetical protein